MESALIILGIIIVSAIINSHFKSKVSKMKRKELLNNLNRNTSNNK